MPSQHISIAGKTLPIREFNLEWMCDHPTIALIAKRGSGKTWVCRSILQFLSDKKKMPGGMIISKTEKVDPFYSKFFPDLYIHYSYTTNSLERMLYRQKRMCDKKEEKKKKGKKVYAGAVLLMDDCLDSKGKWMKDPPITDLFYNGRHYDITYLLTMQFPLGISPELRGNFDYIFLLATDITSDQKRLYEHYAGMFPTLDSFKEVFNKLTEDFGAMVIARRGCGSNLWDKIFWFRANDIDVNEFGSYQFNKIHKKNFNKGWKKKEYELNMDNLLNKKKGSKSSVNIQLVK